VIFYATYDGQPVDPLRGPTKLPSNRCCAIRRSKLEATHLLPDAAGGTNNRLSGRLAHYARSSSDDKSPIVAILSALDACMRKIFPCSKSEIHFGR